MDQCKNGCASEPKKEQVKNQTNKQNLMNSVPSRSFKPSSKLVPDTSMRSARRGNCRRWEYERGLDNDDDDGYTIPVLSSTLSPFKDSSGFEL